jgi:hypothetical protein
MTRHGLALCATVAALVASGGTGCADRPAGDTIATTPPAVAHTRAPTSSDVVPAERSTFPDGVYRSQLSMERVRDLGMDEPGFAGTWTLTVKAGVFKLECQPVTTPGVDCGGHDPALPPLVEVGTLHGTGNTAWFVQDPEERVRLTGCVRHSQAAAGCGPEDAYHFDWTVAGTVVSFKNYVGLGDQAGFPELSNWTAQPWTRIS